MNKRTRKPAIMPRMGRMSRLRITNPKAWAKKVYAAYLAGKEGYQTKLAKRWGVSQPTVCRWVAEVTQ